MIFLVVDESPKNEKVIEIEDGDDHEDQSSPRGVLEIPVSGSDSDNQSSVSRSLSSRGSSFNDKSPEGEVDCGGEEEAGGGAGVGNPSSTAWRNLVDNLKWKSIKRLSTFPLVAGYELSRKSLMKRLAKNHNIEEAIDGGNWAVPKPSWRNFTLEELAAATDNFSSGEILFGAPLHISLFISPIKLKFSNLKNIILFLLHRRSNIFIKFALFTYNY